MKETFVFRESEWPLPGGVMEDSELVCDGMGKTSRK